MSSDDKTLFVELFAMLCKSTINIIWTNEDDFCTIWLKRVVQHNMLLLLTQFIKAL